MQKWIRRSLFAGLTAGVAAGSVGVAHADDTTVVAPTVKSESTSVIGDNSILGGNSLSAPVVAPITGNDVALAGIGGAVNAENVLAVLGLVGVAHANSCGSDDYVDVSGWVNSSSTSVVGDNSIGSGNTASVPVYAPITDNKVAGTLIGGAVNAEDVTAVAGIIGAASCGEDGENGGGGYPYAAASNDYATDALPLGGVPAVGDLGNIAGLADVVGVQDLANTLPAGDVASLLGLGLLGGAGLQGAGQTVNGVVDTATAAAPAAAQASTVATETVSQAAGGTETVATEASTVAGQTSTHSNSSDTTVVAPTVKSKSTSVVGDNSIGSGNSLSAPIVLPVTGNDVAVAGIGGAVNADDVTVVAGVLGVASALLQ